MAESHGLSDAEVKELCAKPDPSTSVIILQ